MLYNSTCYFKQLMKVIIDTILNVILIKLMNNRQ